MRHVERSAQRHRLISHSHTSLCSQRLSRIVCGLNITRNPKVIWEEPRRHPSRQRITMHKVSLVTMGCPTFTPPSLPPSPKNYPFPFNDLHPIWYPSSTDRTHHPKWHSDPISHFSTIHPPDRPPDRQTDRWSRWQLCLNTRLHSGLIMTKTVRHCLWGRRCPKSTLCLGGEWAYALECLYSVCELDAVYTLNSQCSWCSITYRLQVVILYISVARIVQKAVLQVW